MSKKRELCDDCSGLGCFTCGMSGFVEVEVQDDDYLHAPGIAQSIHGGPIPQLWANVQPGAPLSAPQLIGPRQIYSAGTQTLRFEDVVVIHPLSGQPLLPGAVAQNDRCLFQLCIQRGAPNANGRFTFTVELVPV